MSIDYGKRLWKQIFCRHLWQDIKETFLHERREPYGEKNGIMSYMNFKYMAVNQRCLQCNKKRVISKRFLML